MPLVRGDHQLISSTVRLHRLAQFGGRWVGHPSPDGPPTARLTAMTFHDYPIPPRPTGCSTGEALPGEAHVRAIPWRTRTPSSPGSPRAGWPTNPALVSADPSIVRRVIVGANERVRRGPRRDARVLHSRHIKTVRFCAGVRRDRRGRGASAGGVNSTGQPLELGPMAIELNSDRTTNPMSDTPGTMATTDLAPGTTPRRSGRSSSPVCASPGGRSAFDDGVYASEVSHQPAQPGNGAVARRVRTACTSIPSRPPTCTPDSVAARHGPTLAVMGATLADGGVTR